MTANPELLIQRGISEESTQEINRIHNQLNAILEKRVRMGFIQELYDYIESQELKLQELWGFPQDKNYHTWKNRYKFKCQWTGRVFKCIQTEIEFEIPNSVNERDFYVIGRGFVDVGRLDSYCRFSGVEELK